MVKRNPKINGDNNFETERVSVYLSRPLPYYKQLVQNAHCCHYIKKAEYSYINL
jgi:hypothetical protein